jgi:hypothetical protein
MRFVQKCFAVAAVFGFLALVPKASAQFTPPSSLTPYLPANNAVTVTKAATIGSTTVYACSMGGSIAVKSSTPMAAVLLLASENCAWQTFRVATVAPGSLNNGSVVAQSQAWFNANVAQPYYTPAITAATNAAAKTAAVAAPTAVRGRR